MQRSSVHSVLRSTQAYCQQICEKQTLDYGIAFYSTRFAVLPEANQFREVVVDDRAQLPAAFEQSEKWFTERGLVCARWAPAGGHPTPELTEFLATRGFESKRNTVMVLTRWHEFDRLENVRVLPARAMRQAFVQTLERNSLDHAANPSSIVAEAYLQRLDEPQFDMFVATVDKTPAGHCALYQVGDMARVMGLTVLPAFDDRAVAQTFLSHVLTLAKRLAMKNIYVQVEADDPRRTLYEEVGFVPDGEITEFHRSSTA